MSPFTKKERKCAFTRCVKYQSCLLCSLPIMGMGGAIGRITRYSSIQFRFPIFFLYIIAFLAFLGPTQYISCSLRDACATSVNMRVGFSQISYPWLSLHSQMALRTEPSCETYHFLAPSSPVLSSNLSGASAHPNFFMLSPPNRLSKTKHGYFPFTLDFPWNF